MRELILAFQFLTRLPMPGLQGVTPLHARPSPARAAVWFPLVGLVVGALVAVPLCWVSDPRLAALLALVVWVWVTGGLHLDGVADLADGLGAAHGDKEHYKERFLAVLADPHVGSFGVIALVLQLLAKFVLLWLLAERLPQMPSLGWALPLIAAWARLGALGWGQSLPPLRALGMGVSWRAGDHVWRVAGLWLVLLLGLSAWLAPVLLAAPVALLAWWGYLRWRVGGMTGDCLGAGIERVEVGLLFCVLIGVRI